MRLETEIETEIEFRRAVRFGTGLLLLVRADYVPPGVKKKAISNGNLLASRLWRVERSHSVSFSPCEYRISRVKEK